MIVNMKFETGLNKFAKKWRSRRKCVKSWNFYYLIVLNDNSCEITGPTILSIFISGSDSRLIKLGVEAQILSDTIVVSGSCDYLL